MKNRYIKILLLSLINLPIFAMEDLLTSMHQDYAELSQLWKLIQQDLQESEYRYAVIDDLAEEPEWNQEYISLFEHESDSNKNDAIIASRDVTEYETLLQSLQYDEEKTIASTAEINPVWIQGVIKENKRKRPVKECVLKTDRLHDLKDHIAKKYKVCLLCEQAQSFKNKRELRNHFGKQHSTSRIGILYSKKVCNIKKNKK